MIELMRELYPIPRSLTGDGVRQTLARISQEVPLEITEVPTGTQVFDWTVPREWNVDEAWIADGDGNRVVDFAESSLHLLGYSVPVRERLSLAELRERVFTHPRTRTGSRIAPRTTPRTGGSASRSASWIRWRTASTRSASGHALEDGHLTYGEALIPGETQDEFLLSTYVCHPALCNDNLSGVVLLAALGRRLAERELRYSYRLLFSPGTIGPLCWLSRNPDGVGRIRHGLVASCVGDPGGMTYKRSRRRRCARSTGQSKSCSATRGREHTILDWFPYGGDERQFNSPGFDLPVGALSRSPADTFPGYHSSGDDFDLVGAEWLEDSLETYLAVIDAVERNRTYVNASPYGEPQLGKRGLYRSVGGGSPQEAALLWTLSLADGTLDLIGIAERSAPPLRCNPRGGRQAPRARPPYAGVSVALVTGASRGVGQELARALAAEGYDVALAARSDLSETAGLVEGAGRRALSLALDVTDGPGVEDAVARVERELGPLDLVVSTREPTARSARSGRPTPSSGGTTSRSICAGRTSSAAPPFRPCSSAAQAASSTSRPTPPAARRRTTPPTAPRRPRSSA